MEMVLTRLLPAKETKRPGGISARQYEGLMLWRPEAKFIAAGMVESPAPRVA